MTFLVSSESARLLNLTSTFARRNDHTFFAHLAVDVFAPTVKPRTRAAEARPRQGAG